MLPHWTQNDLSINGVRLHYYRTGNENKRPLLLVHGFSDNGLCWTPTARNLESEYDVIMPDMNGIEAAIHIRKFLPSCKVLLFSGQAATADLLESARSQGHEFEILAKPVHPQDLLAKLRG